MGRPSSYDPAYCERVIELGEHGASVAEMAYELGVCPNTLTNWSEEHEEFLSAFTRAKLASQVWWEKQGRENLHTQGFQQAMWSRSMAARFPRDWREVKGQEHSGPGGTPIATTQRIERVVIDPANTDAA